MSVCQPPSPCLSNLPISDRCFAKTLASACPCQHASSHYVAVFWADTNMLKAPPALGLLLRPDVRRHWKMSTTFGTCMQSLWCGFCFHADWASRLHLLYLPRSPLLNTPLLSLCWKPSCARKHDGSDRSRISSSMAPHVDAIANVSLPNSSNFVAASHDRMAGGRQSSDTRRCSPGCLSGKPCRKRCFTPWMCRVLQPSASDPDFYFQLSSKLNNLVLCIFSSFEIVRYNLENLQLRVYAMMSIEQGDHEVHLSTCLVEQMSARCSTVFQKCLPSS